MLHLSSLARSGPALARSVAAAVILACAGGSAFAQAQPQTAPREGVDVGESSIFARAVSAETLEQAATQQFAQMTNEARKQNALLPDNHPQVVRLRAIARRIIPFSPKWNRRATEWQWQVAVINSKELNAFCMPGGKIAFYTGILEQLKLTDDEVATIMGHEVAHALREHARERVGKTTATRVGVSLLSSLLGLGNVGDTLLSYGGQLLTLKFSREDETEADRVGLELSARAGYDPRAGISLWQKMAAASKGAPPQWMSTHPSGTSRIRDIQATLPSVMPLFERAPKPDQRFDAGRKTGRAYLEIEPLAYWGVGMVATSAQAAHGDAPDHRHDHAH